MCVSCGYLNSVSVFISKSIYYFSFFSESPPTVGFIGVIDYLFLIHVVLNQLRSTLKVPKLKGKENVLHQRHGPCSSSIHHIPNYPCLQSPSRILHTHLTPTIKWKTHGLRSREHQNIPFQQKKSALTPFERGCAHIYNFYFIQFSYWKFKT